MQNRIHTWLAAATIMLSVGWIAVAQPTQQLPDKDFTSIDPSKAVGAPKVQITEVKSVTGQPGGFKARVKWSAQVPSTTKIDKFEVSVSVRDSNGNTRTGTQTAAGSARELAVPVAITAKPGTFQATVTTFFITIAGVKREMQQTFELNKANNFRGTNAGSTTPQPLGNFIQEVDLADNTDLKGFDVKWKVGITTQDLREKQTKISGTFTYTKNNQNVGTRTANQTLGVGVRQTRLTLSSSPVSSLAEVKIVAAIKVEVFFDHIQRLPVTLSGSFGN